jgi:hypothetical protein
MTDEPGLSRDTQPAAAIASIRAHAARYRENAAHFTELAEKELVESIRDQWKIVARDYALLLPDGVFPTFFRGPPGVISSDLEWHAERAHRQRLLPVLHGNSGAVSHPC